jgi:hypothetical protein
MILFSLSLYWFVYTLDSLEDKRDRLMIENVGQGVVHEVSIAMGMKYNYKHEFILPEKINGIPYNISLEGSGTNQSNVVKINTNGGQTLFFNLPTNVSGQIRATEEHCITKNSSDIEIDIGNCSKLSG